MRTAFPLLALLTAGLVTAADPAKPAPNTLTPEEVAGGWVSLFDGETSFGWKTDGPAEVKDGALILGGGKPATASLTTVFGDYELRLETEGNGTLAFKDRGGEAGTALSGPRSEVRVTARVGRAGDDLESKVTADPGKPVRQDVAVTTGGPAELRLQVPAGGTLRVQSARLKPLGTRSIFNGKDLTGWKVFEGDAKRAKSKFAVTPAGEISLKDGPGDLQTTSTHADFVLQLECKTNGKGLNSGVFFRCLPDEYQNGYELQVQNLYLVDRTKPADFGTGAIYRRVPARKVVSNDHEWFGMTLVARGNHLSSWVNGYQTVDWTDDRPADPNPRKGSKTGAGHLSLQGHDPTTDLLFRNLRLADLPAKK